MLITVFLATLAVQFAVYGAVKLTLASWDRNNGTKPLRYRNAESFTGSVDRIGER